MFKDRIRYETFSGRSVEIGDTVLTPRTAVLSVRGPGMSLAWVRPTAVLIEKDDRIERRAIVDITRLLQAGLLGLSALSVIFSIAAAVRQRRERDERRYS